MTLKFLCINQFSIFSIKKLKLDLFFSLNVKNIYFIKKI